MSIGRVQIRISEGGQHLSTIALHYIILALSCIVLLMYCIRICYRLNSAKPKYIETANTRQRKILKCQ